MKASLSTATLGLAISLLCAYGPSRLVSSPLRVAATDRRTARQETSKHANGQRKSTAITLTVHVLHTTYGLNSESTYRYPKSISLRNAGAFADQIAAFGGANHVWIGPRGWTGSAALGADGNTVVDLYPVGGSELSGPRIEYGEIPACVACMLGGAAPYFPRADREYEKLYRVGSPGTPPGLRIFPLSPTLVRYSLPDEGSLVVRGVAYFGKGANESLSEARFILPHADAKLLHFLMHTFIRREKLK